MSAHPSDVRGRVAAALLTCAMLSPLGCLRGDEAGDETALSARGCEVPEGVHLYADPPLAHPSKNYRVKVQGQPVFVERHAGVSYARFAFHGEVSLEVEAKAKITEHAVFPKDRVLSSDVEGSVLRVRIAKPGSFVVWLNDFEKLFVLADAREKDAPVAGAPGVFDVTTFGADATGRTLSTAALQEAVDSAAAAGGGTVYVPAGIFRTGTVTLKSNIQLYLAEGSLLQGSADPSDYPVDAGRRESGSDTTLPPDVRYLGKTMTYSRLLYVEQAENVRIAGRGTIDGEGTFLRKQHEAVPNLLRVRESKNVVVRDVLFRNAAAWSLHVLASDDVTFDNVKVLNDRTNLNTDGIDPDMSTNVTIAHSFVYTKDDAICIKATRNSDLEGNPAQIRVRDNLVSSADAALKLGTESSAGTFTDVAFEKNHVFDSERAMSVVVRDGATYDRITYRDVDVGPHVAHLIEQVIGVREPAAELGVIKNLTFENVQAPAYALPASNWTWYAQFRPSKPAQGSNVHVFEGADEAHAVQALRLKNVVVNGKLLTDREVAASAAKLTLGAFVDATFE